MSHPSDLAELRDELRLVLERFKSIGPDGFVVIETEVQAFREEFKEAS